MCMATNDIFGLYIAESILYFLICHRGIDGAPCTCRCTMTDQDRRGILKTQVQHIRPGPNEGSQSVVELPIKPDGRGKLDRIVPFRGRARRFVIDKKEFVVPPNDGPAVFNDPFSRLPRKRTKTDHIARDDYMIDFKSCQVRKDCFQGRYISMNI